MTNWIKMRKDLDQDGRVWRIAESCGIPRRQVIGCLHAVWAAADSLSTDGVLRSYTDAVLDRLTEVPGFAAAMREVGWLKDHKYGLLIPEFTKHMGQSEKKRAGDRERQRRKRLRDKPCHAPVTRDSHAPVTRDSRDSHAAVTRDGERDNRDSHASREEKKREEEKREDKKEKEEEEGAAAAARLDAVLTAAEAWAGGGLLSAERDPLVRLVIELEEQEPATIRGVPTPPVDLLLPAIDEARRTSKAFKSGRAAAQLLGAIVRDCIRRGLPPGDFGAIGPPGSDPPPLDIREKLERIKAKEAS